MNSHLPLGITYEVRIYQYNPYVRIAHDFDDLTKLPRNSIGMLNRFFNDEEKKKFEVIVNVTPQVPSNEPSKLVIVSKFTWKDP